MQVTCKVSDSSLSLYRLVLLLEVDLLFSSFALNFQDMGEEVEENAEIPCLDQGLADCSPHAKFCPFLPIKFCWHTVLLHL